MGIKVRFAILFSIYVAVLMIVTFFSIYFLYYQNRKEDYYHRLTTDGELLLKEFGQLHSKDEATNNKLLPQIHNNVFYQQHHCIIDSNYKVLFVEPDTIKPKANKKHLDSIRNIKGYRYQKDIDREGIGFYAKDKGVFVFISGEDISGLRKLQRLKFILTGVFIGGLFITAFMSFLLVNGALKPLERLSLQMQKTTELNLSERIDEGKGKDEINRIAHSYNGMLERLKNAFESQKNFVHHASHELRTPLATMYSQTEAALNKNLSDEEYKKVLKSLREDQNRLIELTNSLLLLSQYERLKSLQKWPLFRIDETIYDVISSTKKVFTDIRISFSFTKVPEDENEVMVKGNEVLLRSAFSNLIKNAYQYSSDKKINIIVELQPDNILIHFDNDGDVLSSDEVHNIKMPFFRGENAAKVKGFGLGLAIVERIVHLHNGSFVYSSIQPSGNRFTIGFNKVK